VGWRLLFFLGGIPALLVVFIMSTIREPAAWMEARARSGDKLHRQMGDIRGMFRSPRWRRNTWVGMSLGVAGVVGLWGVGFWSPELITRALLAGAAPTPEKMHYISKVRALGTMWQDVGAFFGIFAFTVIATRFGRRISFALSFIAAFIVVSLTFLTLRQEWQVYVLLPLVGFVTLSVFGGYSIYFPEIYPTSLRSSGTSFCYNSARIVTAAVIVLGGPLQLLLRDLGVPEPFRWGAVIFCGFYVVGLIALIWAPETKDQPLPEEEPLAPHTRVPVPAGD
jgi:MFS family permease